MIEVEEKYMTRCIELARNGAGNTSPNPMVGAVIVHEGRIIGEGYHRKCGEGHAEVNAIASVKEEAWLKDSTMYVSLEPCSHYGKTPPCAELIIKKGIPRVVVGSLDPFPEVAGRGIQMLQEAGVEVVTGVMKEETDKLNRAFMTLQRLHRPFILLKWAESADGYMDRYRSDALTPPIRLSNPQTRRMVHKLRAETAAIMVGTRTALLDNPSLTVRYWAGKSPLRVVIDTDLSIPADFHLLDGTVPTLVFTDKECPDRPNVEYIHIYSRKQEEVVKQVVVELANRKIDSLMVEGGANLLGQFLSAGLWDEVRVETAPVYLKSGVKAPNLEKVNGCCWVQRDPIGSSGRFITLYHHSSTSCGCLI